MTLANKEHYHNKKYYIIILDSEIPIFYDIHNELIKNINILKLSIKDTLLYFFYISCNLLYRYFKVILNIYSKVHVSTNVIKISFTEYVDNCLLFNKLDKFLLSLL